MAVTLRCRRSTSTKTFAAARRLVRSGTRRDDTVTISVLQWPQSWSRQQRSSATIALASVILVLLLWLMAIPMAMVPDPIGNNAQYFAEGTRVTVELTVVAGLSGILIGVLAALGRTSRVVGAALDRLVVHLDHAWYALAGADFVRVPGASDAGARAAA